MPTLRIATGRPAYHEQAPVLRVQALLRVGSGRGAEAACWKQQAGPQTIDIIARFRA